MFRCVECLGEAESTSAVIGLVSVRIDTCKVCGHVRSVCRFVTTMDFPLAVSELERVQGKHVGTTSAKVKAVIAYLQSYVDSYAKNSSAISRITRKRREDLWEKEFVKTATSDY